MLSDGMNANALLCQCGIDFLIELTEIRFADIGFEDFAFFADEDGSRINLCAERLSDGFIRIIHDGKGQTVVFDVLADAFYRIDRLCNGEYLEIFIFVVMRRFNHFGHFAHATGTGGKPKINQGYLTLKVDMGNGFAVHVGQRKCGSGFAVGNQNGGNKDADQYDGGGSEYFFHSDKSSNACASVTGRLTVRCVFALTGIRVISASAAVFPFGSVMVWVNTIRRIPGVFRRHENC